MTLECLHFELVVSIWFAGCFCAVSSPPGCVWHQEDAWGKVLIKPHLISWEVHHVHSYSNSLHASPQSRSSKGLSSCTIWILVFPTGGANAYCILLFCFPDKDSEVGILYDISCFIRKGCCIEVNLTLWQLTFALLKRQAAVFGEEHRRHQQKVLQALSQTGLLEPWQRCRCSILWFFPVSASVRCMLMMYVNWI